MSSPYPSPRSTHPAPAPQPGDLFELLLALGDDALVLGHRLSEWSGKAPTLEEDIALSNLALDLIGQARLYYGYAGEVEGRGRSEDDLAFFRDAPEFRCLHLVQLPPGDFAFTILRQLVYAAFMQIYLERLSTSADPRLAEIATKAVKEMGYHVRHAAEWLIRLADGTETSRARVFAAIDAVAGLIEEMFVPTRGEQGLAVAGVAPDRRALRTPWAEMLAPVLREAGVALVPFGSAGVAGRGGRHTPHLALMLAEMQSLARAHPGARW